MEGGTRARMIGSSNRPGVRVLLKIYMESVFSGLESVYSGLESVYSGLVYMKNQHAC